MSIDGRIMVIGASGRIGYRLCEQLRQQNATVLGAARFSDPDTRAALEKMGVQTLPYNVQTDDPATLPDADLLILEVWDPQRHAGPDAYEQIWSLNYTGVGRLVARYAGRADVVNGCSGNVYGSSAHAWTEADAPRPDTEYGLARFAQEKLIDFLCDQAGSRVCHLRYFHANTPDSGAIHRLAQSILRGESLGDAPDAYVRVIGMVDFVRCTLAAAARLDAGTLPRAVNIVHPTLWTRRQLAERIHKALGQGAVVFDRESGGVEQSVYGEPSLMLETFGPPEEDLDTLIDQVCAQVREEAARGVGG
ncbi:MAG: NAD-dependent epimerase/dehydratase family protein [Phycisphaeraceae bacterium]